MESCELGYQVVRDPGCRCGSDGTEPHCLSAPSRSRPKGNPGTLVRMEEDAPYTVYVPLAVTVSKQSVFPKNAD
jgi:hypothetical protein